MLSPTRRQRGEGTVHRRADGQWRGQLELGYVNGRRQRKTVYGRTQAEVVRKMRDARRAIEAGDLNTKTMRLEKWLRHWVDNIVAHEVKPKTLVDYRSKVEQYLIPTIGQVRLDKLGVADVRAMHKQLRDRDPKLSTTTIHHAHRVLTNALNQAVREGRRTQNPASLIEAPAKAANTRRGLSVPEARAVLTAAAKDERLAARWLAAFLLGARQGEILGLRWSYVDLDRGLVDVAWSLQAVPYRHGCTTPCGRRSASCPDRELAIPAGMQYEQLHGGLCLIHPKTQGSRRIIPLAPPLWAALQLHKKVTPAGPHDLVWARPDGRPIDARRDHLAWTALLESAEVPHVTAHEARHTTATLLLEAGVDPHVIGQILGHSDVITTRGYQHVDQRLTRDALTALGERLSLT